MMARRDAEPSSYPVLPGTLVVVLSSSWSMCAEGKEERCKRVELTDEQWERLAPLLPPQRPRTGCPARDHRTVLNFRRLVARFEKCAAHFLAMLTAGAILIWLSSCRSAGPVSR